jgi:hypothetical protein
MCNRKISPIRDLTEVVRLSFADTAERKKPLKGCNLCLSRQPVPGNVAGFVRRNVSGSLSDGWLATA